MSKLRDTLYNIVDREGDFSLQFFADMIRGRTKHTEQQRKPNNTKQPPLSTQEQSIFQDLLKRKPNEEQIEYWKRKKAFLNHENKKSLVQAEIKRRAQQKASKDKQAEIDQIIKKRQQQMNAVKQTKQKGKQR